MYKQGNTQLKPKSGIIHYIAFMGPELIKKRKTLGTDLENLVHTERLKEFSVLQFARDYFISCCLQKVPEDKKQNYIQ